MEEGEKEVVIGDAEADDDGVVIDDLDLLQVLGERGDLRPEIRFCAHERVTYVRSLQFIAIVKFHALAKVELELRGRHELPRLGQAGDDVGVFIHENQRVENCQVRPRAGHVVVRDGVHGRGVVLISDDQRILRRCRRRTAQAQYKHKRQ